MTQQTILRETEGNNTLIIVVPERQRTMFKWERVREKRGSYVTSRKRMLKESEQF